MLFNTYTFLFLFLPIGLFGFFSFGRFSYRLAASWLAAASLFFYGFWNPRFVLLLLASIGFNYTLGYAIVHAAGGPAKNRSRLLAGAVTVNLLVLGYFKYANFFISTVNSVSGTHWRLAPIVLPLGISFFTFTQIAYLVDVRRGIAREYNLIHYLLFVSYFPHLVAGPVLHHRQMMPQFEEATTYRLNLDNISIGLTILIFGLGKKVILADQFALYANPVFDAVAGGSQPALVESWMGSLAYTLQLYFDFSGYSDMAIGMSRLFNIKLPLNFNSPYKAGDIIEFWRRWHMSLSAFLKEYLYVPLGGNRRGKFRRYVNLMVTMLLGGLWHGASWKFVFWGGLHGTYLVINHLWGTFRRTPDRGASLDSTVIKVLLTFCLVVIAWVPFRANDIGSALRMLRGMSGANGISLPASMEPRLSPFMGKLFVFNGLTPMTTISSRHVLVWLAIGLGIVWGLPNVQQWMARVHPAWNAVPVESRLQWQPRVAVAVMCGAILALSVLEMTRGSRFLYFQF